MSDSTPPNWPIFDISFDHDQISQLVKRVYPEGHLVAAEELGKRMSFNNRIYFLSIKHEAESESESDQDAVLKVVGRFFDGRKVQNEVASLLMLAKFCPEIPTPRVLAWSEDGDSITAIRQGVFAVLSDSTIDQLPPSARLRPWIMLSKCPGRTLTDDDLSSEHSESFAENLAEIVGSWRQNISHREEFGNIQLQPAGYTTVHDLYGLETLVSDILLTTTQPKQPPQTLQEYYAHLLSDQIHKIETQDVFTYLRPRLLDKVQTFQTTTFPQLSCFEETNLLEPRNASVFTHQDFAPRNILVTPPTGSSEKGPLLITGILDFEFSGFFAPEEEFLTSLVRQSSDWPKPFTDLLLQKLEAKGVATPITTKTTTTATSSTNADGQSQSPHSPFEVLVHVIEIIEHVAPWWLQAGHISGRELEQELEQACEKVEASMELLERDVS